MVLKEKKIVIAVGLCMLSACTSAFVPSVPSGWSAVSGSGASNVRIYKNSSGDHMQVINISAGAKVKLIQEYSGFLPLPTPSQPGNKHAFRRYSSWSWWNNSLNKPVTMVNGQFFATDKSPDTYLSFPIRMDQQYAQGYNTQELSGQDRQLEINSYAADVLPFNVSRAQNGPNSLVIAGFSPNSNFPKADSNSARTVLCSRYVGGQSPWLV